MNSILSPIQSLGLLLDIDVTVERHRSEELEINVIWWGHSFFFQLIFFFYYRAHGEVNFVPTVRTVTACGAIGVISLLLQNGL